MTETITGFCSISNQKVYFEKLLNIRDIVIFLKILFNYRVSPKHEDPTRIRRGSHEDLTGKAKGPLLINLPSNP